MKSSGGALRASSLCLLLALGACSTYTPPPQQPPAPVTTPKPEPATPAQQPRPVEPAVSAHRGLIDKAREATARGDYDGALALLERAQRIDPDDAEVYLNLARTHAARGDSAMARASAERGLLYCRGESQCRALRVYTR